MKIKDCQHLTPISISQMKTSLYPTFRDDTNNQEALDILQSCFPDREVFGIDSVDIIWGLGSFHCLSQQEPAI